MSNSGKKTPLQLNAESQLAANRGWRINPVAVSYQGTWLAGPPFARPQALSYSQGSVTSTNCTGILTSALPNFYNNAADTTALNKISTNVFRNLIKIGRPIDSLRANNNRINCPALGNSRPDNFLTSFAGWGSFKSGWGTDQFYNKTSGTLSLAQSVYPPQDYPVNPAYSYVWNNWRSIVPSPGSPNTDAQNSWTPFQEPYQYYHEYSWLTGWPGINAWQENNAFGAPQDRENRDIHGPDLDTYGAAYFPRPDLASVQPWRARDRGLIEYDEYFRYGFVGCVARQAYYEFWSDFNTRRSNQYFEFARSWQQHLQYLEQTNKKIASFDDTKTFIKGNYSNINDLTTSDLAGVSLAFRDWGNDMINLGKTIDLTTIYQFGLPSAFLKGLQKNNALTDALRFALMYQDLNTTDLEQILQPTSQPTAEQEKKIYSAFEIITGNDLTAIKIILNIATTGLTSLADLINPRKMFPNSYQSLTVPRYTLDANSAKVYDFIYTGDNTNNRIQNWGGYLEGTLPADLARACGAFMCTMNQVKNIKTMNVEKLSQVIANLEVTNKDLPQVNSADGVPGSVALADQELAKIALGSGGKGVFRFCDFFGAMSGWPYRDEYEPAQRLLGELQTTELTNVYKKLYQKSLFNNWALISRGKGWPDSNINTTGIPPTYTYNLFTAGGNSVGAQTMTIAGGNVALYNIFSNTSRSSSNPSAYTTGQLVTFQTSDSASTVSLAQTYVVTSHSSGSVTFESILGLIPNPNYQPNPSLPNYDPVAQIPPYSGWPGLSRTVAAGERVYVWELEYNGYPGNGILSGTVQNLVDAANLEILRIQGINQGLVTQLNTYWDRIGRQLWLEQRAVPLSITQTNNVFSGSGRADIDSWIRGLEEYAQNTGYCETAPILDAISNTDDIGGQSIVAAQREARNARRLTNVGGETDNDVADSTNSAQASARAQVSADGANAGVVTQIQITSPGSGYSTEQPPSVLVYPQGGAFGGGPQVGAAPGVVAPGGASNTLVLGTPVVFAGSVQSIPILACGPDYSPDNPPQIVIGPPPAPLRPGAAVSPGSFAGSPYSGDSQDPVPDNLIAPLDASYTPDQAVEQVTICNCECWQEPN
jgi:DNA-directed RNA polymerase subunit H (RpoH/RPB5)